MLWREAEIVPSLGRMMGTDRRCRNKFFTDCGVAARAAAADNVDTGADVVLVVIAEQFGNSETTNQWSAKLFTTCLLYTSDAADE